MVEEECLSSCSVSLIYRCDQGGNLQKKVFNVGLKVSKVEGPAAVGRGSVAIGLQAMMLEQSLRAHTLRHAHKVERTHCAEVWKAQSPAVWCF